jgi:dTDP-4-amino-4,6-dideoxygalactose transaminase
VQLGRLDEFIAVRRRVAALYDEALEKIGGVTPLVVEPGCDPNYYKYVAFLDEGIDRQHVKEALRSRGVSPSGEVYATPLHRQPVFAHRGPDSLPVRHAQRRGGQGGRSARCRRPRRHGGVVPPAGGGHPRPSAATLDPVEVVLRPPQD